MDKKYRVVFLGLNNDEENFKQGMSGFGVTPSTIERMIKKAPIVLKGEMTLGDARRYADAVFQAGGRVRLQAHGLFNEPMRNSKPPDIKSFGKFTMCPQCGYKQMKAVFCKRCGFLLSNGEPEGH